MPRPIVRKKFALQPAYASTIDRSHPIGRKVTACIAAHYGAPIQIPEMISGIPGTVASGQINAVMAGAPGKAVRPSTTGSALYWPARSAFCDGSQAFSIEILFTCLGTDAQYSRVFDFGAAQGGGVSGGWDIEAAATSGTFNLVFWSGTTAFTLSPAPLVGLTIGQTYHFVFTYAGTGNQATYYVNTVLGTGTAGANLDATSSANFFYSTYHTAGDLSATSWAIHFARFYQGSQLTYGEVKRLYERPFEMFRPPRRIWTNTVSGGGGVTLALTGVQATSAAGSIGTGQLLTAPLTGTAATSAVGSVSTAQLLTLGLTGVSTTSSAGTVGVIAGGDKAFALTGVQAQTQTGNVGVQGADSTSQGGHFLPLTEKQLRNLKKEERKRRRQEDDREAAKLADARSIEAEIRELAFPTPVKPQEFRVETATDDDEDEDLELILLHS
jgi:hypothetical protein